MGRSFSGSDDGLGGSFQLFFDSLGGNFSVEKDHGAKLFEKGLFNYFLSTDMGMIKITSKEDTNEIKIIHVMDYNKVHLLTL